MNIKNNLVYGGTTDIGQRRTNEDFLAFKEFGDDVFLGIIADGAGSKENGIPVQPAIIAATEIISSLEFFYESNPEIVKKYPIDVLSQAMKIANNSIGHFKVANEKEFSGLGVCISCCLIIEENFFIVHAGNTRIYLIRHGGDGAAHIVQLTNDHTSAARMVSDGTLAETEYYSHPSRYRYTSGLGIVTNPEIQTYSGKLRKGDTFVLTTDGIHYSIKPEYICDFVVRTIRWEEAAKSLIEGAKYMKMEDNMTAALIYYI